MTKKSDRQDYDPVTAIGTDLDEEGAMREPATAPGLLRNKEKDSGAFTGRGRQEKAHDPLCRGKGQGRKETGGHGRGCFGPTWGRQFPAPSDAPAGGAARRPRGHGHSAGQRCVPGLRMRNSGQCRGSLCPEPPQASQHPPRLHQVCVNLIFQKGGGVIVGKKLGRLVFQ